MLSYKRSILLELVDQNGMHFGACCTTLYHGVNTNVQLTKQEGVILICDSVVEQKYKMDMELEIPDSPILHSFMKLQYPTKCFKGIVFKLKMVQIPDPWNIGMSFVVYVIHNAKVLT